MFSNKLKTIRYGRSYVSICFLVTKSLIVCPYWKISENIDEHNALFSNAFRGEEQHQDVYV